MPALDQDIGGAERGERIRLPLDRVLGLRLARAEQGRRFRQIRRDQRRQRDKMAVDGGNGFVFQEPRAGGRNHHRIEHDVARLVALQPRRHGLDQLGRRQHADLHRRDVEILENGVDLLRDEVRRHGVDGGDALRILRRQRDEDAGAIDLMRREGLEIGLDAGAAARIRAGDGQGDGCHGPVSSGGIVGAPQRVEHVAAGIDERTHAASFSASSSSPGRPASQTVAPAAVNACAAAAPSAP